MRKLALIITMCVLLGASAVCLTVPGARAVLLVVKGQTEAKLGWKESALEDLSNALSLDPNSVDALMTSGTLLEEAGENKRAESCFEKLLQWPSTRLMAIHHLTTI